MRQNIAIIGSGISGLGAAYLLSQHHDVTVFEADDRLGGHSHTVDIGIDGQQFGVDTGFLVFNERTYPLLCRLFSHLQIPVVKSDMSFSVKVGDAALEWAGTDLNSVFAQRRNIFRVSFWRMLRDILRFNRQATADLDNPTMQDLSLGDYLDRHGYSSPFRNDYLLPMAAAIWSCPTQQMLAYPFHTFVRFCHNHGLLQILNRPTWMTIAGGSRVYVTALANAIRKSGGHVQLNASVTEVERSAAGVCIHTANGKYQFDKVILGCHSDQTLRILGKSATPDEKSALSAIAYQPNRAVLHTDTSLLPQSEKAWAAWNYAAPGLGMPVIEEQKAVSVSYLLNKLQPLPTQTPVIVTLNPWQEPAPEKTLRQFFYAHPVFDAPAIQAQSVLKKISGQNHTYFTGAWLGYGFHEDGFASAVRAASQLAPLPDWILGSQPDLNTVTPEMGLPAVATA